MIGAASVALAVATWGQYLWRIPRERISRRPWGALPARFRAALATYRSLMPRENRSGEAVVGEDALHDVDYDPCFRLGHVPGPGRF